MLGFGLHPSPAQIRLCRRAKLQYDEVNCDVNAIKVRSHGWAYLSTLDKPMLKINRLPEVQLHLIGFTSEPSQILENIIGLEAEAEAKVLKNLEVPR